jgi:hypothetical protein
MDRNNRTAGMTSSTERRTQIMSKITKQNVGGTDYTMVGCALTGVCASAADAFIKAVTLSDGDEISDGMTVIVTFANGNTAGTAPASKTIYSSDQVNYYEGTGLTIPFTLAPAGCYEITYTGEGNAYTYISYPVIQIGSITGPLCDAYGNLVSGAVWLAGYAVSLMYKDGKFLALGYGQGSVQAVRLTASGTHLIFKISSSFSDIRRVSMFICVNGSTGVIKNSYVFQTYGTWQAVQSKIARIAGKWNGATFYLDSNRNLYIDLTMTSAQTLTLSVLELTDAKVTLSTITELPASVTELPCNLIGIDSIPNPPSSDGNYNLRCSVASGVPTFSWV